MIVLFLFNKLSKCSSIETYTSSFFSKIGVISGNDLTTEASLTKLMFLLANVVDKKKLVDELENSICGELTES